MFCSHCGHELPEGTKFCTSCGAPVPAAPPTEKKKRVSSAKKSKAPVKKISENITLCEDGKYRWTYEVNLFRNPTVFLLVWKIFFFIFLGIFAVIMIADATSSSAFFPDRFLSDLKFLGYFVIGMTAVIVLSYLIYAAIMGGKYTVEFEMDEKGINHSQIASQAKKARAIGGTTTLLGIASGNYGMAGAGIAASRTSMYTGFNSVRKVIAHPKRNLIKISAGLEHNQVYVAKEDFEFVKKYITAHCPRLREK